MKPYRAENPFDWVGLLGLIKRAFAGMEGRIDPPSSLARLTAEGLAAHEGEVWVIGRPPVACMLLTRLPHALSVGKLSVDPAHKGKGYSRRLIETAEARARAMGLPALELQSRIELIDNHAIFYGLGFRQVAEHIHPGYDRPTSLTFSKQV